MLNLIFIDDDKAAHIYHQLMVEDAGLDVERTKSFYTADETLKYLARLKKMNNYIEWPSHMFVDINMPIKSGFEFLEEFRANAFDFPWPKIYFVSSTTDPLDIHKIEHLDGVLGLKSKFLDKSFFESLIT